MTLDTPVIPLDGDQPVPLRECEGRDVWTSVEVFEWVREGWRAGAGWQAGASYIAAEGVGSRLVWPIVRSEVDRLFTETRERYADVLADPRMDDARSEPTPQWWQVLGGDDQGWTVHAQQHDIDWPVFDTDDERDARALADHLNATGWQPPAPEPERPTWQRVAHDWADGGDPHADWLAYLLAEHGYAVVDVRALAEAIDWLRGTARWEERNDPEYRPARALLDALGVDR